MDLVEKWSAFLPHAEHISPTQFCAITLGDVREMIAEYQAMRARVAELEAQIAAALPIMASFASRNPRWEYGGVMQDPNGVHAWIERNLPTSSGEG